MADDFQAGICSGSWWIESSARSTGFDAHAVADNTGSFVVDEPSASASSSSITFQDSLMLSPSQIPGFGLSPSTMDWAQALLKTSGRVHEGGLQPYYHHGEPPSIDADRVQMGVNDSSMMNPFKGMSQSFLSDHDDSGGDNTFQLAPGAGSYGDFYEPDNRSSGYDSSLMGYYGSLSNELPKFSSKQPQSAINHFHFSNDTPFWNAPASQFTDQKPNFSTVNTTAKANTEGARCSSSSATKKSGSGGEHALKKPRLETPSPLPTFKVRKEKLGDRITALQQLVSPFGKTDTASVLHEAILYIKFLHEQVVVLSTPYMKNGHPMQQQKPESSKDGEAVNRDLRSRGLCLVPVASTYTVASETPMDFWTPTFGGTFR